MKVKTFTSDRHTNRSMLQFEIREFLEENPDIIIKHALQSESLHAHKFHRDQDVFSLTITIFYEEKKEMGDG